MVVGLWGKIRVSFTVHTHHVDVCVFVYKELGSNSEKTMNCEKKIYNHTTFLGSLKLILTVKTCKAKSCYFSQRNGCHYNDRVRVRRSRARFWRGAGTSAAPSADYSRLINTQVEGSHFCMFYKVQSSLRSEIYQGITTKHPHFTCQGLGFPQPESRLP